MKQKVPSKKFYIIIAVALLSVATILCGATLTGLSSNAPLGTKLNVPIGNSIQLVPNKNGGYFLIQNNNEETHLSLLDAQGNVLQEQTFDKNYQSICLSKDSLFILLKADIDLHSPIVTIKLDATSLTNYSISKLDTILKVLTVSQNGTLYGVDALNTKNLLAYTNITDSETSTAILVKTFENGIAGLCTSSNDELYTEMSSTNKFYHANISQGLPYEFSSYEPGSYVPVLPTHTLTNDLLLDAGNNLFRINHNSSPLFTLINKSSYTNACLLSDGSLLGSPYEENYIEVLASNGTVLNQYSIEGECLTLAANKTETGIILKRNGSLYFTTLAEVIHVDGSSSSSSDSTSSELQFPNESDNNSQNSSNSTDPPSSSYPDLLESNKFLINRNNNTIMLPPSTTFAVLRDSLNSTKDTIVVKNLSGTNVSSGNLGTGYTVSLQINGATVDKLTIIVKGDINGTGTVNSKDVLLLYNYLNESEQLTQTELLACDLNNDDIVDTSDLLLLKQQVATAQ